MLNDDFRNAIIGEANERPVDEAEISSNKQKVLDGQALEVMMKSTGGRLLERYFIKHLNLDFVSLPDDKLVKQAHEINAIKKLREYIVGTIETKNRIEGEKNE